MTQYKNEVEKQAKLLAAEEWAVGVKGVHAHSMNLCGMTQDHKILMARMC